MTNAVYETQGMLKYTIERRRRLVICWRFGTGYYLAPRAIVMIKYKKEHRIRNIGKKQAAIQSLIIRISHIGI